MFKWLNSWHFVPSVLSSYFRLVMLMTSIVYFTVAVKYVRQPLSQDCTLDAKDVYLTFLFNVVSHLWEHICIQ